MSFHRHHPSPARASRGPVNKADPAAKPVTEKMNYYQIGLACDRFLVQRVPGYRRRDAIGHSFPLPPED